MARQFVEHDYLICIHASQAVRTKAPNSFDQSCLCRVAQCVQPGSVQPRSRVAIVTKLGDQFVIVRFDTLTQKRKL
jgi:hypothetical protein